ncbi:hypothetical protein BT69DRAFT_1342996, partial [Atractiella rhizophila]
MRYSLAYVDMKQADRIPLGEVAKRKQAYLTAAEKFVACAEEDGASKELRWTAYRKAAKCFSFVGEGRKAGLAYSSGQEFDKAVKAFLSAEAIDDIMPILSSHSDFLARETKEDARQMGRLFYLKVGRVEAATPLFDDPDDQISFLKHWGYLSNDILQQLGRHDQIAITLEQKGDYLAAARELQRTQSEQEAEQSVLLFIKALWQSCFTDVDFSTVVREAADTAARLSPNRRDEIMVD